MAQSRYARQILFPPIGEPGQEALAASTVVLIGCGALGSAIADAVVRAGVGRLRIVDRDFIELNNLQRQMIFDEDDVAQQLPKAVAAARKLARINSEVTVEPVVADLHAGNAQELIGGADLVLDGTDNFETRYLINELCVREGIPWVYGGVVGASGMSMTIRPGQSACLRCVFREPPPPGSLPTADTAGIISPIVRLIAAVEVSEGMKLLTGSGRPNTGLLSVELWEMQFHIIDLAGPDVDCPICGRGHWEALASQPGDLTVVLQGRNSVQITPHGSDPVDLAALAQRLAGEGQISLNRFLLRFEVGPHALVIFPEGRALVQGTTDPEEARALYSRYVRGEGSRAT